MATHLTPAAEDEHVVVGGLVEFGVRALGHLEPLTPGHIEDFQLRAIFRAAVEHASLPDLGERVMTIGDGLRRLPPGYDLSWSNVTEVLTFSPLVPETLTFHAGRVTARWRRRSALWIASEIPERLARGDQFRRVVVDAAEGLLSLCGDG